MIDRAVRSRRGGEGLRGARHREPGGSNFSAGANLVALLGWPPRESELDEVAVTAMRRSRQATAMRYYARSRSWRRPTG